MLDFNHIYKVLATIFLETLAPTRCVVCDEPGDVLCPQCASSLPLIDPRLACPRCAAPFGHWLCTECPNPGSEEARAHPEEAFPFMGARAALSFEESAQSIIRTYKDGDELRLDASIASLMCKTMRGWNAGVPDWTQWADALCYAPASPEAILRRGFDHMERIARLCAQRTGIPLLHALESRQGSLDQRDLDRSQRIANRAGSFTAREGHLPARILLLDDVFTTGATASAATRALLGAGAQEVRLVVCARVW